VPNKYTGPLGDPPQYVVDWLRSGLTAGQLSIKTGMSTSTIASRMSYWRKRVAVATIEPCWIKTTHEAHGWTEVDGEVRSLVDASTVLQVPEGSKVGYHHCIGVPDYAEAAKNMKRRESDPYNHDRLVEVERHRVDVPSISREGPSEVITERRVALDAVYERVVVEGDWRRIQQLTCWCCTCGDREGSDAYCRNHGATFGERPCDIHGVQGSTIIDFDLDTREETDSGVYPDPVSVEREKQRQQAVDLGYRD
jgi:hypothetical protein